jgi:hexaprenyl-diphosphate synthase
LAKPELQLLSKSMQEDLIGTDHPVLNKEASYFFDGGAVGKKVRPMMILLLSRALADSVGTASAAASALPHDNSSTTYASEGILFSDPLSGQRADLQAQRRLTVISEMIHTASLFHDDVIDEADTRHMVFGNKMAILARDYLLA